MRSGTTIAAEIRKRRHAEAQARSAAKRRKRDVPRRDDFARAAYYVMLLAYTEAGSRDEGARAERIRNGILNKLEKVGFDRTAALACFEDHVGTAKQDLETWIRARRFAQEKITGRSAADKE